MNSGPSAWRRILAEGLGEDLAHLSRENRLELARRLARLPLEVTRRPRLRLRRKPPPAAWTCARWTHARWPRARLRGCICAARSWTWTAGSAASISSGPGPAATWPAVRRRDPSADWAFTSYSPPDPFNSQDEQDTKDKRFPILWILLILWIEFAGGVFGLPGISIFAMRFPCK